MRSIISGITIAIILMTCCACGLKGTSLPEDFTLRMAWNTGSLPPKYRYEYVITLDSEGQGVFEYTPGYGDVVDTNRWVAQFSLKKNELEELYQHLSAANILRSNWKVGCKLIGGSTTSLIIKTGGYEYRIPSISELQGNDLTTVTAAMDVIRSYVPDAIWTEMESRQAHYEAGFDE